MVYLICRGGLWVHKQAKQNTSYLDALADLQYLKYLRPRNRLNNLNIQIRDWQIAQGQSRTISIV